MKLRRPWLIKTLGFAGAQALRLWLGTLQYRYRPIGPWLDPHDPDLQGRYIYVMWHETLLLPIQRYARPDICVLISRHDDGQLAAEICQRLSVGVIRGSTTRGSVEAVRGLLDKGSRMHLAITPDGPRGPRRRVQPGVIYLASRLGLPIVPTGFGFDKPWRAKSWDRFVLPKPWSRATCVTGPTISIPQAADKTQIASYRQLVEIELLKATTIAEHWAQDKVWTARPQPIVQPRQSIQQPLAG
jgi:lysophospholipid acyltransferase (LPLAT)-like uncharacterized protein